MTDEKDKKSKIFSIVGGRDVDKPTEVKKELPEIQEEIVEELEALLEKAKKGEIQELVYASTSDKYNVYTSMLGVSLNPHIMFSALTNTSLTYRDMSGLNPYFIVDDDYDD